MQIMEDHSTPARSVVFHIVSLNHFFKVQVRSPFFPLLWFAYGTLPSTSS